MRTRANNPQVSKYQHLYKEAEKTVMNMAHSSPLNWFFELHQREVIISAKMLLHKYPRANQDTVILACWFHDLGHFRAKTLEEVNEVKPDHHIAGSQMAEKLLKDYELPLEKIQEIKNCILCHRGTSPYVPKTLEEKIVAVADTLSHFQSILYLLYFKIYPNDSLSEYVKTQKTKLSRDWRDLALLPEGQELARPRYKLIMGMLDDFEKNIQSNPQI